MPSASVSLSETDIIKLVLEFLHNRKLDISMLSLERETGVVNGQFSDDLIFLRQLILDGQWDDAIDFVQPLNSVEMFDIKRFKYLIIKHKYLELLCIKSEPGPMQNHELTVEEVVECLNSLEQYCPSKEEYSNLCLLLTLPRISDHAEYQDWNPSSARLQCFRGVLPLVDKYLVVEEKKSVPHIAQSDRLLQLLVNGLLYESCVEYCQYKATCNNQYSDRDIQLSTLLNGNVFSEADLSLLSWLQSIPGETFSCAFEQKSLNINLKQLEKPSLEVSWSEQILVTPIKPKMFPHSAVPTNRPRSADAMSRSLMSQFDGLSSSLQKRGMNSSLTRSTDAKSLSRSLAGYHLNTSFKRNPMTESVDKLFESVSEQQSSANVTGSSIKDMSASPQPAVRVQATVAPSPRLSLPSEPTRSESPSRPASQSHYSAVPNKGLTGSVMHDSSADLYNEYQRQKQRLQEEMAAQDQQREIYRQQLEMLERQSPLLDNRVTSGQTPASPRLSHLTDNISSSSTPKVARHVTPLLPASPIRESPHFGGVVRNLETTLDDYSRHEEPTHADPSLHMSDLDMRPSSKLTGAVGPEFIPLTSLEDGQAVRAVTFSPRGDMYAVGSNSKTLRVCSFPDTTKINSRTISEVQQPSVVFKRSKHHKGSIYCVAWSGTADVIATGSNDKTVKLLKFNTRLCTADGPDTELVCHDGTVRDLVFLQDGSNSPTLISGGAGDCKIYITDCATGQTVRAMPGHSGHVYSLHTWGGSMFVSGSQDKTSRLWDVRTSAAIALINCPMPGSAFASVCVESSGQVMASGHEDASCMLYDLRGARVVQHFKPHSGEVRSARFSMNSFYLLTGSYDQKIVLTNLQGDLTQPLASVPIAQHTDKVIQCRWHPHQLSFVSTSADRTVKCWTLRE